MVSSVCYKAVLIVYVCSIHLICESQEVYICNQSKRFIFSHDGYVCVDAESVLAYVVIVFITCA